jgi:hypothetical protein
MFFFQERLGTVVPLVTVRQQCCCGVEMLVDERTNHGTER